MNAFVQLKLDRLVIDSLCRMGYMHRDDRDPTVIRAAVTAALADRLAPSPAAPCTDARPY